MIDLPLTYTEEKQQFNDASELEQIFLRQEEQNLFCIHRLQEAEENFELENKNKYLLKLQKGTEEKNLKSKKAQIE